MKKVLLIILALIIVGAISVKLYITQQPEEVDSPNTTETTETTSEVSAETLLSNYGISLTNPEGWTEPMVVRSELYTYEKETGLIGTSKVYWQVNLDDPSTIGAYWAENDYEFTLEEINYIDPESALQLVKEYAYGFAPPGTSEEQLEETFQNMVVKDEIIDGHRVLVLSPGGYCYSLEGLIFDEENERLISFESTCLRAEGASEEAFYEIFDSLKVSSVNPLM